jgi:hypothetical protein
MPEELEKNRQGIRRVFRQPVSTSGISIWVKPPTHNQGVDGVYPTMATLKIKHLQGRLAGVFCFTPGLRQDFEDFTGFLPKKLARKFV